MNEKIDILIKEKRELIEAAKVCLEYNIHFHIKDELNQSIRLLETFITDLEKLKE